MKHPEQMSWRERAEELEAENGELQERLDAIADLAAPERAADTERIERVEKMVSMTLALVTLGLDLAGNLKPEDRARLETQLAELGIGKG